MVHCFRPGLLSRPSILQAALSRGLADKDVSADVTEPGTPDRQHSSDMSDTVHHQLNVIRQNHQKALPVVIGVVLLGLVVIAWTMRQGE